ncbi:type VII toxin-antitoxin system MntA family adenylyltransferase antitoxin [Sulfuricystis multivorans]|uniref:type VII toxin-antitoxin system MntA family adenylyltransferase antitoxin n=1 Tax=Sulfuricystis multivorans TaxID=2211108 RepID=UPI000F82D667|nr:nucleotidyltransferase domain-containing protein [Sulfuricystis multivorans]
MPHIQQTPPTHPLDDRIVALLKSSLPDLQAIYRYGSAGGPYERPDSDIDLAILAKHPLSFAERLQLSSKLMSMTGRDIDFNDLRTLPVTLRVQIVMHGVRLYAADQRAAEEYDSLTLSDYVRLNEERRAILDDIHQRGTIHG